MTNFPVAHIKKQPSGKPNNTFIVLLLTDLQHPTHIGAMPFMTIGLDFEMISKMMLKMISKWWWWIIIVMVASHPPDYDMRLVVCNDIIVGITIIFKSLFIYSNSLTIFLVFMEKYIKFDYCFCAFGWQLAETWLTQSAGLLICRAAHFSLNIPEMFGFRPEMKFLWRNTLSLTGRQSTWSHHRPWWYPLLHRMPTPLTER